MRSGRARGILGAMEVDPERAHAKKVRLMARLTWPVLMAALTLVVGPAHVDGDLRVLVLALAVGAVAGLNVPSYGVLRRAMREQVPVRFVRMLAAGLALRLGASFALAWALW